MAIAYEGAVGGSNLLTAFPANLLWGDYIQATLSVENVSGTPTAATDWILISTDLDVGAAGIQRVWTYYIIRGASDPANNWVLTSGMVSYIAFSGVEGVASPFNQTFQQADANASSLDISGRTTDVADVMKVAAMCQNSWAAWASSTMPNEALDMGGSGPTAFYYETAGAAGPTGTESFTGGGVIAGTLTFLLPGNPPPLPPVYRAGLGAKSAGGTTTVTIAYPTGLSANDQIFAFRNGWESDITFTAETGWTSLGGLAGGTGTAIDSHTTEIRGDRKDSVAGTESGTVVFDQTGGTTPGVLGIMVAYHLGDPTDTWDLVTSTGDDATHAANRAITASTSTALAVDDVVIVAVAVDTDTALAAFSAPAITASGITFGTTTRLTSGAGVGTGDDGNIELFEATVTAGSGTVALALAFTTTTAQCGPALFVRLRAVNAAAIAGPSRRRRPSQLIYR